MFVISFKICLFIYFSVKYAIQSNDCDVFVNKQSIYLSLSQNLIKIGQIKPINSLEVVLFLPKSNTRFFF